MKARSCEFFQAARCRPTFSRSVPEVVRLLHALIIRRGAKRILELGTSYGYSTAFLADATRQTGGRVYTPWTLRQANSTLCANASSKRPACYRGVEWMLGDAAQMLKTLDGQVRLCIGRSVEALMRDAPASSCSTAKLAQNAAVVVADNIAVPRNGARRCKSLSARCRGKGELQSVLLPIGSRD